MKKVFILSQDANDLKILADFLRLYFPGTLQEHHFSTDSWRAQNDSILINVEEDENKSIGVRLEIKGKQVYCEEALTSDLFPEEGGNRRRRILRLAIHKALAKYYDIDKNPASLLSPWGVLTGVRPTKIAHRFIDKGFRREEIELFLTRDYGMKAKKARLLLNVAYYQRPYLPNPNEGLQTISLYIGIPFCPTRCHYCSFPSFPMERYSCLIDSYYRGLLQEISAVCNYLSSEGIRINTIYIGGGTPTVLSPEQLSGLFKVLRQSIAPWTVEEITVEGGRPDTLDREKIRVLMQYGVKRLSINPQTMHQETLEAVGRNHSVKDIIDVYELAREEGVPEINMDLIIGLPGEDIEKIRFSLDKVISLQPENVTLHALAIKRAAHFGEERPSLPAPSEGLLMMDTAQGILQEAGYEPYYLYRQKQILAHGENVGYTVKGKVCAYNILMMEERQPIIGFGVGAGSKLIAKGTWGVDNFYNPKDLGVYLERLPGIIDNKVDKLKDFVYNNC